MGALSLLMIFHFLSYKLSDSSIFLYSYMSKVFYNRLKAQRHQMREHYRVSLRTPSCTFWRVPGPHALTQTFLQGLWRDDGCVGVMSCPCYGLDSVSIRAGEGACMLLNAAGASLSEGCHGSTGTRKCTELK